MRRLAPVLVLLALVLAGCGDDGGDSGDDRAEDSSGTGGADGADGAEGAGGSGGLEPCGALTPEAVQQLTGVEVESTVKEFAGGATCSFSSPSADDGPTLVVVSEGRPTDLDDLVANLVDDPEEATVEPLEVEGALEAAQVEDESYGISSLTFIATTESGWYSVAPFQEATRDDEVRVGVAALTALLGGEVPADAVATPRDVAHPCELVPAEAVAALTGVTVTQQRFDEVEGLRQCTYTDADRTVEVSISDFADRPAVDASVAGARSAGADVEEVTAPGVVEAYVVTREELDDRVSASLSTADATYMLDVTAADADAAGDVATGVIEALGAASDG